MLTLGIDAPGAKPMPFSALQLVGTGRAGPQQFVTRREARIGRQ